MKSIKKVLSYLLVAAMLCTTLPTGLAATVLPSITIKPSHIDTSNPNGLQDRVILSQSAAQKLTITVETDEDLYGEEILWMIITPEPEVDGAWDWDTAATAEGFKDGVTTTEGTTIGSSVGITSHVVKTDWTIPSGAATYYLMLKGNGTDTNVCFVTFSVDASGLLELPKATATAEITTPAADGVILNDTGLTTFAGTATKDTTGEVSAVKWALADDAGKYLDGRAFDSDAPVWDAVTGTGTWTLDLSGKSLADGDYILSIVALDDNAGVDDTKVVERKFVVDNTAPMVESIVRCAQNGTEYTGNGYFKSGEDVYFLVTYDEPVKGVSANDFLLAGGNATYDGAGVAVNTDYFTTWIATVTGTSDGEVELSTATSNWTAQDQAGNTVDADQSKSATYTYDTTAPVVASITVGATDIQTGAASNAALAGNIVVAVTEDNPVITGNVTPLNDVSGVAIVTGADTTTALADKITGASFGANGTLTIAYTGLAVNTAYKVVIGANVIADLAGNKLSTATTSTNAFTTTNGIELVPTFADGSANINKVYGDEAFTNEAKVDAGTYPDATATIEYSTSAATVADVDASTGEVTIKGVGTATITATTTNVSGDNSGTPYMTGSKTYTVAVARKDIQGQVAKLTFAKEYDGTTDLALGELQATGPVVEEGGKYYLLTTEDVAGEKLEITAITATYTAANVGTSVGVTVTGITFADDNTNLVANYKIDTTDLAATGSATTLTSFSVLGKITTKALTWKGTAAGMTSLDKTYDGTRDASVASTLNETASTYLDGVATGDQSNVKLTIAVGEYKDAYAAADAGIQAVTLPGTALSLTGTGASNYTLPASGSAIQATIAQATPTFRIAENGTDVSLSTAKSGVTPQVSIDNGTTWNALADLGLTMGASGAGAVQLAYWVATPAVDLVHCNCGYGNAQGHLPTCAGVVASDVSLCDCDTLDGTNASGAATSSTAIGDVHDVACAYAKAPTTGQCDCGLGDTDGANVSAGSHDWGGSGTTTKTCAYAAAVVAGGSWVTNADAITAYLNGLAAGDVVQAKVYMTTGTTNLVAVADPGAVESNKTGSFTVVADPLPPSGGGVSSYTVTYDVGEHGKLAEGASKTERVNHKKSPKKMPEVIANKGYKFLGWSLDGKTVVDPAAQIITKSITFTALYEGSGLTFDKTLTMAYIKGIEENGELLFKPEAPMTRGEVAVMLVRTLNKTMDATKDYATGKFPDLNGDEWYAQAVGYLAELGVMKGMEDGTASAEKYITRAEFVALVMRIDGLVNGENKFPDVGTDNWAVDYITAATAKGYIDGDESGNFLPGADITRAAVVKIMNGILGWTEETTGEMLFVDVAEDHWAYSDIVKASTGK